jgi:hypothetical protein
LQSFCIQNNRPFIHGLAACTTHFNVNEIIDSWHETRGPVKVIGHLFGQGVAKEE